MPPTKKKKISNTRGRPLLALSQRKLVCACGGESGTGQCKIAVYCHSYNIRKDIGVPNAKYERVKIPSPSKKRQAI